jgi:hypothetical protein
MQDELLLDFTPKSQLRKESKKVMEQLAFSPAPAKPRLYPQFFSHKPGYVPWFLDESEALILLDDIRKSMRFSELMKQHPGLYEGRRRNEFPFWLESATEPLTVEKLTWQTVSSDSPSDPAIDTKAFDLPGLIKKTEQSTMVWELIAFYSNMTISEGTRPYYSKIALGADADSGMILGFHLGGPDKTTAETAAEGLIKCIESTKARPATVLVESKDLAPSLQPLTDSLGIKLNHVKSLPMANEARRSLESFGSGR